MKIVLSAGGTLVCDFCGSSNPDWDYPCENYEVFTGVGETGEKKLTVGSLGHWAACTPCHRLIELGDRERLALRCVATMIRQGEVESDNADEWLWSLRMVQDTFWWHRTGSAIYTGKSVMKTKKRKEN